MRMKRRGLKLLVVLVAALLAASVGSGALRPTATTVGVGLTLSVDQSALGVTVGSQAVVLGTVSQPGSLLGSVSLAVTGAPSGATVTYPHTVIAGVPFVISVLTGASTPVGSYALQITATSGTSSATITVNLVVSLPTGFTMVLSPPSRTVVDGSSTSYTLNINRGLLAGAIGLQVTGLPQYATASVSPSLSILGSTATVNVNVPTNVVPGSYLITVKGTALLASATASAYLIVQPQTYPNFPISGTPDRVLSPGGPIGAINVSMTNPFNAPMTVTNLGVALQSTDKTGCGIGNYQVTAYSGPASLTIPANSTRTLQQLGVPRAQWPQVQMLNLPSNQDACKTALVQYKITATGNGA
ncbi:COG1470 family protein [Marmoricola sp. RAF53]|uniref:COG1470 family protein n=1 Tax=Marmoricola sp. RAF53 TaxID=3233059 RepID=UPI003F99E9E2